MGLLFGGIFAQEHAIIFAVAAGCSALCGVAAVLLLEADTTPTIPDDTRDSRRTSLLTFDWLGASLSALGLVGVTVAIALAGTNIEGWKAPSVISLLPIGICLLIGFFLWERQKHRQQSALPAQISQAGSRRHALRGPLVPPSVWSAPGFSPALACVWFGWFAFNTLTYYSTLFFQEVQGATPIQTSIRYLPMVAAGILANIAGGVLLSRVRSVYLILGGCSTGAVSCAIFALQDVDWVYARGMLPVLLLVVGPDVFFPAIQLFACRTVGSHRAALAGSLFNVTTRLATSIGLASCSLVQGTATIRYSAKHSVPPYNTSALMAGYRAAGWLCFTCSVLAAILALVYLRHVPIPTVRRGEPDSLELRVQTSTSLSQP
jgi:hypothetical protein